MKFNAQEGCFQLVFENGVTLSVSTRFAFGYDQVRGQADYAEVRAWDPGGIDIELPPEYSGRIDVADYLVLAEKLSHPDLLKCQDCESIIRPNHETCQVCGEGLSHPWLLLI